MAIACEVLEAGGAAVVGRGHDDVVDVVVAFVRRRLEVGRRLEGDDPGAGIDVEQVGIRARERIGDVVAVGIVRLDGRHDVGRILAEGDRRRVAAAVRTDDRSLRHVRHRDGEVLLVGAPAVEDLDRHLVDAVTVEVGRVLEVRRTGEGEFAVVVDVEEPGILAAEREARGRAAEILIRHRDGRHQRRVLVDADVGAVPFPVRGDDGIELVDRIDRDADRLLVDVAGVVGDLDGDLVDVVAVRIRRGLEVRRAGEGQFARGLVDFERGAVKPSDDREGEGAALRIERLNRREGVSRVLLGRRGRRDAAAGRNDGRRLVDRIDIDDQRLLMAEAAGIGDRNLDTKGVRLALVEVEVRALLHDEFAVHDLEVRVVDLVGEAVAHVRIGDDEVADDRARHGGLVDRARRQGDVGRSLVDLIDGDRQHLVRDGVVGEIRHGDAEGVARLLTGIDVEVRPRLHDELAVHDLEIAARVVEHVGEGFAHVLIRDDDVPDDVARHGGLVDRARRQGDVGRGGCSRASL